MQPLGLRSPRDRYHERPLPLSQLPRGAFSSFWKPLQGVGIHLPSRLKSSTPKCCAHSSQNKAASRAFLWPLGKAGGISPQTRSFVPTQPHHTHTHIIIIIIGCSRWWVTSLGPCAIPQPHPSICFFSSMQFSRDEKAPDETLLKRLRSSAHQERVPLPEWIPSH